MGAAKDLKCVFKSYWPGRALAIINPLPPEQIDMLIDASSLHV
jgi:hypothetical protein